MSNDELKQLVEQELKRLMSMPEFSNAKQSAALLRFLVTESVEGRASELKEYVLGVHALGRPSSFDPRIDPIVRVEVSRLRNKLELCYARAGTGGGSVRIALHRGTYAAEFQLRDQAVSTPPAPSADLSSVKSRERTFGWLALSGIIAAAFALGVFLTLFGTSRRQQGSRLVHLSITTPKDSAIDSIAVSPDGTRVLIAASKRGISRLYLRSIADSFDPDSLPGTEDASFPFWSPDGRSVGFFAERKLKVLQLNSETPRIVADAPLGRGGAWTKTGEIVFAPGALGPLKIVSADGGSARVFTALDQVHGEVSHLWPVVLPNSNQLAFLSQNRDPSLDAISAVDLKNPGKHIQVISANSSMAFAQGESNALRIYLVHDGALVTQQLSRDLQPRGDPTTVAPQVDFHPLDRYALFSSSRQNLLAFVPGTPFRYRLTWLNRSGVEAGRLEEPGDYFALKLSPNGSHLLVNRTQANNGSTEVWSVDVARRIDSRVTSGSVDFFPIWSPDGSQVAFARADGTAERGMRLSTVSSNGGPARVLLDVKGPVFPSDWSHDGAYLACTFYGPLARIEVVSMTGQTPVQVWSYASAHHNAGGAVFQPSRPNQAQRWIAYTSDESGRNEVYLQSFPDGNQKLQISASGGDSPLWRADGKELFFLNADQDLMSIDFSQKGGHIGIPRRLFRMPGHLPVFPPYSLNYAASPDVQTFLVRVADSNSDPPIINVLDPETISRWSKAP